MELKNERLSSLGSEIDPAEPLGVFSKWRIFVVRIQVMFTEKARHQLKLLAAQTAMNQSELIRQAVDQMLESVGAESRSEGLRSARGLWSKRKDLPNFAEMRREIGRS
jgi:hypothetical protein